MNPQYISRSWCINIFPSVALSTSNGPLCFESLKISFWMIYVSLPSDVQKRQESGSKQTNIQLFYSLCWTVLYRSYKARNTAKRYFECLKKLFPTLHCGMLLRPSRAVTIIIAALVLYMYEYVLLGPKNLRICRWLWLSCCATFRSSFDN